MGHYGVECAFIGGGDFHRSFQKTMTSAAIINTVYVKRRIVIFGMKPTILVVPCFLAIKSVLFRTVMFCHGFKVEFVGGGDFHENANPC